MGITVCIAPVRTLEYPEGGGHLWEYLNWALGLRAIGCKVIWLEAVAPSSPPAEIRANIADLELRLERYGLVNSLALYSATDGPLPADLTAMGCLDLDAAAGADLLLEFPYDTPLHVVKRFRRSALLDIDPGLSQAWISKGRISLTPHDVYFTTGETVGQAGTRIPDLGLNWIYTPPCVALDLKPGDEQWCMLEDRGWRVVDAHTVATTPWDYQHYIQDSFGEFSCAKPACLKLENAWVSNRTLCYLASGKPAVVQHTGPSRFLPDSAGLFRFRDLKQAAQFVEKAVIDYKNQCKLARALAEEYFDARNVVGVLLERALS